MTAIPADELAIRQLELRRVAAMRDGDADALGVLLADELFYLHSNATSDSRGSLLAKIRSRELQCPGVVHSPDDQVIVTGDTAVATGRVTGTVQVNGHSVPLHNRALAVWHRQPGGWRLIAYQSTPIPAA